MSALRLSLLFAAVNLVASHSPLRVMRVVPESPADPNAEVTVTFDRPVAGGLGTVVDASSVFSIVPAVDGVVEWRDPVTLRFRPAQPLEPGATYTVTVTPLEAIDGSRLESAYRYSFRVATSQLLTGWPVSPGQLAEHVPATPRWMLLVSLPIEAAELARSLRIDMGSSCGGGSVALRVVEQRRIAAGDPVHFRWTGRTPAALADTTRDLRRVIEVEPESPLPLECAGSLVVSPALLADAAAPQRWSFRTYGPLRVIAAHCAFATARWCPTGPIRLRFSTPVRGADVVRRVRLIPGIEYAVRDTADVSAEWVLDARLEPRTSYAVSVDGQLEDIFGQRFTGRGVHTLRTTGYAPAVEYAYGRMLVEKEGLGTLAVQHVNVDTLIVTAVAVPDSMEANFLARAWNWEEPWAALVAGATHTRLAVRGGRDERRVSGVRLPLRGDSARGGTLYALQISSPSLDSVARRNRPIALVQVTNLAIHARIGADEGVVWVTGVEDGLARAGADVTLHDALGRVRATARTDAQGLARLTQFRRYPGEDECEGWCYGIEAYVSARLGTDRAVVGIDPYDPDLAPWRFGLWGAWDADREPAAAALFTERGIYRPGEVVHAKAIVRSGPLGTLAPPARGDSIHLVFFDREGSEVHDTVFPPGEFGTGDAAFALPADAPLGVYSIQLQRRRNADWHTVAWHNYQVAEYRPPEFLVDVRTDAVLRFAGDSADVTVSGRYLFGAPMGHAPVSWSVRQTSSPWGLAIAGAEGYNVGVTPNWWESYDGSGPLVVAQDVDTLDATGSRTLRVPLPAPTDGRPASVTVQATVTDANRQTASSATALTVHPAAFYLGARPVEKGWFWTAGTPVQLEVIAVRPDGERVVDVDVRGAVVRREWHRVRRVRNGQVDEVGSWVSDTVARCDVRTSAEPVRCGFTPQGGGSYTVTFTARDARGRLATTGFSRWASGGEFVPWSDESQLRMDIVPDRPSYEVGDTATLFFAAPFVDAEAWVTVERERVLESRRIRITSGATTLRFPITEAHAPNAFVSIVVVRGRSAEPGPLDDPGRPTLRVGYAELRVLPEVKRLAVEVTPLEAEYEPGDTAAVRVNVRDRDGRGQRAEVTLWAVDEGVLALTGYRTPDPIDQLYARRGVGVRLASNLVSVAPQIPEGQKGRREAGGGGGGDAAGILRSRFQTTAFFLGSVITDTSGQAVARAKLPDNLTTFRVMAVAVTAGDRYGSGESSFLVTRPLVARPALPRFVREGDRFLAGAVINHRLGGTPDVEVTASAEGIRIEGDRRRRDRLAAGRGVEVRFGFRAIAGDSARFTFDARSGDERDAVRLAIPVNPSHHPLASTVAGVLYDTASATFVLEDDVDAERSRLELSFGTSPFAVIQGVRRDLHVYPYYCTEQISSIALPLIALRRAEQQYGGDWQIGAADREIDRAVRTLLRRQTAEGGIGYWSPLDWTTPTLSAWAGRVLLEARSAGAVVDSSRLEQLAAYLTRSLNEESWRRVAVGWWHDSISARLSERLVAADFLSRYGAPNIAAENSLLQQAGLLRWEDRLLLAEMLARRGELRAARPLLDAAWRDVRVDGRVAILPRGAYRTHYFDSHARPAARLLTATLAIDPSHAQLGALVETLVQHGRVEATLPWNTHDYGHLVLALVEYARVREAVGQPTLHLRAGRRRADLHPQAGPHVSLRDTTFTLERMVTRDAQGRNVVRLDLARAAVAEAGGAPVYFYATVREVPKGRQLNPVDRGITVERWYESLESATPIDRITEGELVRVRLRVTVPVERRFVVLDDPLPAGLEPVDLSLRTVAPPGGGFPGFEPESQYPADEWSWWYGSWDSGFWSPFDHREMRDDRVVWSAAVLWKGTWTASYLARATTAGTFVVPPAHAEEMYNPGVNGRTAGGAFVVTRIER